MRKYENYWSSNPDWYYFKNGRPVMSENAPEEAKESFKRYLEQHKQNDKKIMTDRFERSRRFFYARKEMIT